MRKVFFKFIPFWIFLILFKFGAGLHYVLMPVFGERVFPVWAVGLLIGGASLIQMLCDVPAGKLLDRYGYRRLLMVTTIAFIVAAIALLSGFSVFAYILTLSLSIFGWLFFTPGINAYMLSQAPKSAAGKFMSFKDVFGSIGIVLSTFALPIALTLDIKISGMIILVVMMMTLIAIYFSPKENESVHVEKKLDTHFYYVRRNYLHEILQAMKKLNPASSMLFVFNITSAIFYATIWFVVPIVIANEAMTGAFTIGLGIFDFAVVVLGYILGTLVDRGNKRTFIFFGLLLFAIAGMFTGFNFNWLFLVFGFLATTGEEIADLSLWSWLHALDKDHANDGLIAGVLTLAEDLGWAIGPVFAGFVFWIVGGTWTIVLASVFLFLTWIFCLIMMKTTWQDTSASTPERVRHPRHKV
jgi:MFS family permease